MARLPQISKILQEKFPSDVEWIPELIEPINDVIGSYIDAVNHGITFKDNIAGDILVADVNGIYPLDIKWTNRNRPIAAWIGQCREKSNVHTTFSSPLFLDWEFTQSGFFRINNIAGLTVSSENRFNVTIIAITG